MFPVSAYCFRSEAKGYELLKTAWLPATIFGAVLNFPNIATADILAVPVNENSLPYELSPNNYTNSPSNYANSKSNYANSASNYSNSPSNYSNSPSNYANREGGDNKIITEDGKVIGYYVFSDNGVLNFYSYTSGRVAFLPSGDHTQSVFSEHGWCGLIGEGESGVILGLSQSCYFQFLLEE